MLEEQSIKSLNTQRNHIIQIANKYGMNLSKDTPMTINQVQQIVDRLDNIIVMYKTYIEKEV